jgi:hypothetical protein
MNLIVILLGALGWGLGLLFVVVLMRMAGDQDRAARHEQKRLDPLADVTITRNGEATDSRIMGDPTNGPTARDPGNGRQRDRRNGR